MTHQTPLLHSGTQRNHKDFASDVPSNWKIMVVVVFGPSRMSMAKVDMLGTAETSGLL